MNGQEPEHHLLHPFTTVSDNGPASYVVNNTKGVMLQTDSGAQLLDAMSGLWCVNVGYGNQVLVDTIHRASSKLSFAHCFWGCSHQYVTRLADRLIELAPGNCMKKVFFGHSGSDANDTNAKLAKLYFLLAGQPQRTKFLSCHDSYHGTTYLAANLSGLPGHHRNFAFPETQYIHISPPDVDYAMANEGFASEDAFVDHLVKELEETIDKAGSETIAAFFAEPIMAVAGILIPPTTYFPRVKKVLDRYGILLVMDDVVCSFGRVGHWFGWETTGVQPDLVSLAKGLTSGYVPMSASMIGERVASVIEQHQDEVGVLGHGFTMSGHPVAAAAALANIAEIEKHNLLEQAMVKGQSLVRMIQGKSKELSCVLNVRGKGMLIGIQLVRPGTADAKGRAVVDAGQVCKICLRRGLVVRAVPARNTIALCPPLIISQLEMETLTDILVSALGECEDQGCSPGSSGFSGRS